MNKVLVANIDLILKWVMVMDYTYENVKNKIKISGVTNAVNEMFGSHITCDRAIMFGEKPIDDKLL